MLIQPPVTTSGGLQETIAALKIEVENGLERLGHFKRWQAPADDYPLDIKDRHLHPLNPTDTDIAIIYRHGFAEAGTAGLAVAVGEKALANSKDSDLPLRANYEIMKGRTVEFMMMLATMYPGFVKHLIDGDLFFRYAQDPNMRRAFDQSHPLLKRPGNYLQGVVLEDSYVEVPGSPSTSVTQQDLRKDNSHKGKGLTFNQLFLLYHTARKYLPVGNTDLTMVKAIDVTISPPPDKRKVNYSTGQFKYVQKGRNDKKFEKWLDVMKKEYIDRISDMKRTNKHDPLLDIPMRVSYLEVGWGVDVKARANTHDKHEDSNALITFFQALLQYLFEHRPGEPGYVVRRLATNYITTWSSSQLALEAGRCADVGITMVAQTEWFEKGLNPQPGGGGGVGEEPLKRRIRYVEESAKSMFSDQGRFKMNIVDDRLKMLKLQKYDDWTDKKLSDKEAENELKLQQCRKEWDAIEADLKLLEDVRLTYIADQLVEAGQFSQAPFRRSDPVSGINFAIELEDKQGEPVEEEEEDVAAAEENQRLADRVNMYLQDTADDDTVPRRRRASSEVPASEDGNEMEE